MGLDFTAWEAYLSQRGVAQMGYSDLTGIVPQRYQEFPYGITLVWQLLDGIVDEVRDLQSPTYTYYQHYRAINAELDSLTLWLATQIERAGYRALPIGASQSVHDMGHYSGAFQHKTAAVRAGLGWIGKSALFVSPEFGPRVRLATVLTDAPLPNPQKAVGESRCADCLRCTQACPAGAIKGENYVAGAPRESIFDPAACSQYMKDAYLRIGRGSVCGICMSVCPWGVQSKARQDNG